MAGPGLLNFCGNYRICREPSAGARKESAGMRARSAQIQAGDRRRVARMAQQRTHREQLVERQLAMEDVSPRQTVVALEVQRRDDLRGEDVRSHAWRVSFEHVEDVAKEAVARSGPVGPQRAWCVMDIDRGDMRACWRKAAVNDRWNRQFQPRLLGELPVRRVVVSRDLVTEFWSDVVSSELCVRPAAKVGERGQGEVDLRHGPGGPVMLHLRREIRREL